MVRDVGQTVSCLDGDVEKAGWEMGYICFPYTGFQVDLTLVSPGTEALGLASQHRMA